jgi:hypothetical protein
MRHRLLAAMTLTLLFGSGLPSEPGSNQAPALSSLQKGCRLSFPTDKLHPRLWLKCECCSVILLGRASLEGQVAIGTNEQALEFVRLFTTWDTWYLSSLERMIEVTAGKEVRPYEFTITKEQFERCCVQASAMRMAGTTDAQPWFEVTRTVVDESDHAVYSLTEFVSSDGRLVMHEKRLLTRDGDKLGRFLDPYAE